MTAPTHTGSIGVRSPLTAARRAGRALGRLRAQAGVQRVMGRTIRGANSTPKSSHSYGVVERCGRPRSDASKKNGVGLTWKLAWEPTSGIEPETSFLPRTSLPSLWHPPVERERNASNYGVVGFRGSRFPFSDDPKGVQSTRMSWEYPSAILDPIGHSP